MWPYLVFLHLVVVVNVYLRLVFAFLLLLFLLFLRVTFWGWFLSFFYIGSVFHFVYFFIMIFLWIRVKTATKVLIKKPCEAWAATCQTVLGVMRIIPVFQAFITKLLFTLRTSHLVASLALAKYKTTWGTVSMNEYKCT